jgi:LmbE family N-acetylglucosaminyl deacetylase
VTNPRLLVVVAHPDDETFGCGSLLLHAAARGAVTSVCCATRGEAGEPRPSSGVSREQLPEVRERELREAAAFLGVRTVELLAFRDSDMEGDPHPDALVAAPIETVVDAVLEVIERIRPHVVVTLDASDGHRDHARIRAATVAAVERSTWDVERLYLQCLPRSLLRRWAASMRQRQPDSPYLDVDGAGLGTPDELVTTVIDSAAHFENRRTAMTIHASQTSPYDGLPDDLARAFLATEHLQRLLPTGGPEEPESDLFEGLTLDRG